jgi:hypothetical protein
MSLISIIEEVKSYMNSVDIINEIKKRLLIECRIFDKSGVYGYTQTSLAFNYNSVEDNKLTRYQVISIFENGILPIENNENNKYMDVKDIEEITASFKMFKYLLNNIDRSLDINFIYEMYMNFIECFYDSFENNQFSLSSKDKENLENILNDYSDKKLNFEDIVKFHVLFLKAQPFYDLTMRIGKMIMFKQCLDSNIIPFIIRVENKDKHMHYLYKAKNTNSLDDLINFFKEEQENYLNDVLDLVVDYDILRSIKNRDKFINYLVYYY